MKQPKDTKQKKKLWWLKDKPFQRIRLSTLMRLGLIYTAETNKDASEFILWLEKYLEYNL